MPPGLRWLVPIAPLFNRFAENNAGSGEVRGRVLEAIGDGMNSFAGGPAASRPSDEGTGALAMLFSASLCKQLFRSVNEPAAQRHAPLMRHQGSKIQ